MKLARIFGAAAIVAFAASEAAAAPPTAPAIDWMPARLDSNTAKLVWNMWWGVRGTRWEVWDGEVKLASSQSFATPHADPNFSQKGEIQLDLGAGSHALKVLLCNADGCTASGITTVIAPTPTGGGGGTGNPGTPVAAAPTKPVIDWMPAEFDDGANVAVGWNMWWGTTGASWELWDGTARLATSTSFGASANPGFAQNGKTTVSLTKGAHSLVVKLCNGTLCTASDARAITVRNGTTGPGPGPGPGPVAGPETYYLTAAKYLPTGRIDIGQALLADVWNEGPFSVQIPRERAQWAMALAHAAQLFRNVTGIDDIYVRENHYLATAIQESRLGADAAASSFTYARAIADPRQRIDYREAAVMDGFFQIQGKGNESSAFAEMRRLFPTRFGTQDHQETVSGARFATGALTAAYYNLYMWYFLVGSGWEPTAFVKAAADPQAFNRIMAVAYNRGLYHDYVSDVFTTRRAACLAKADMADATGACFPNNDDEGSRYARQIPTFNRALVKAAAGQPDANALAGYGAYDTALAWADIQAWLDTIAPLYAAADMTTARSRARTAFDGAASGGTIRFRDQFGPVLDAVMLALPVDTPAPKLCSEYGKCAVETGNNGGGGQEPPATGTLADCRTMRIGQPVSAACLAGLEAATFGGPAGSPKLEGRELMTYFAEWGTWGNGDPMQGRNFNPADLAAAELTRVNYAFLVFSGGNGDLMLFDRAAALDKAFATDSWDGERGLLKQFWLLKARFPHLKVYFAVGGWNHTGPFPAIADDPVKRARLVQSAYDFVTAYGFDGIDIDWEYPGHAGNVVPNPRDRANFTALMCELSAKFKPRGLGVSFAAGANPLAIAGVDYPAVLPCVTNVNLMTYDFNGTWSTQVGHNAPLFNNRGEATGQGNFNVHDTVMNVLAAIQRKPVGKTAMSRAQRLALFDEVPAAVKAKIVVGAPFYGRGWSRLDRNPTEADIWATGAGAAKGSWEHVAWDGAGMADANDLLDIATGRLRDYLPAQPVRLWDRYACVPMYVDRVPAGKPRAGETFAYSHDDADSLQHKAAYVRDRGLGGIMTWEADGEPRDHRLTAALARGLKGQAPAAMCIAGGTDTIQ